MTLLSFGSAARISDMADRKAELEKKRRKLEELKKAREQNKLQTKDKEVCFHLASSLNVAASCHGCCLIGACASQDRSGEGGCEQAGQFSAGGRHPSSSSCSF